MAQTSQETFNIECNCWKEKNYVLINFTSLNTKKGF